MKNLTAVVLGLVVTPTVAMAKQHTVKESASFTRGNDTFRIAALTTEVTEPHTFEDFKVEYSIYKNGAFFYRRDRTGGSTSGCLYGDRHQLPKNIINPLKIGDAQIGWSFNMYGICGNTTSMHQHLIVIPIGKDQNSYSTRDFISKTAPIFVPAAYKLSTKVWYAYQEWGDGGTAGSFFVPKVFSIAVDAPYGTFKEVSLPENVGEWPVFADFKYSNASYIAAGIQALQSGPVRYAAQHLDPKDLEHLQYVGLPSTKEALLKLADQLDDSGAIIKKFRRRD